MLEVLETWDVFQGEKPTGSGTIPREKYVAGIKDGRTEPFQPSTPETKPQDLESAPLGFSLALVRYSLTMPQWLLYGMAVYILCHCMVEVHILLLIL